jgi:hypothetical protein
MKIILFEYFLKHLVQWYCEYYKITAVDFNNHPKNDLSKLKVLKLHFFACSTDDDALDLFDDFHALPYGHVESTIFNNLHELTHFSVDNNRLTLLCNLEEIAGGDPVNNTLIENIVRKLRTKNFNLISMKPFDLVEMSHRWFSWNFTFNEARKFGLYSKSISPKLIKQEAKSYSF